MDRLLAELTPEFYIWYVLLSVYASAILIHLHIKEHSSITKPQILIRILLGFTPFYNVLVTGVTTLFEGAFKINELWDKCIGQYINTDEDREETRKEHIFGFMKYKGIEMSELDEYIESRNLMRKMLDKIE